MKRQNLNIQRTTGKDMVNLDNSINQNSKKDDTKFKKGQIPWNKNTKGIMKPWNKEKSKYPELTIKEKDCECGKCNQKIIIKPHHKYTGIPKYIRGHNFKNNHFVWNKGKSLIHSKSFKIRNIPWNKGMSKEEWLSHYKNGSPNLGMIMPKGTKIKISETKKELFKEGKSKQWTKGKSLSLGHRIKLSEARKNLIRNGYISPLIGIHRSKETRSKIKQARAKQITPIKDTSIEVKIQGFLKELNIDFFTHQYIKEIEHGYQCDILIPSMNLVIEADGNYWHHYPIRRDIDNIRTQELIEKGFKVLRLWEIEIKEMNLNGFKELIYNIK